MRLPLPADRAGVCRSAYFAAISEIRRRTLGVPTRGLPVLLSGAGLIALFFTTQMITKVAGIWPLTRIFRFERWEENYTTLLMATALTFGTISALFGLTNGIIDQTQYTILVTVVIGSAVIPTLIARRHFEPKICRAELHVLSVEERLPAYAAAVDEVNEEERFEHRYLRQIRGQARRRGAEQGVALRAGVLPGHAAERLT